MDIKKTSEILRAIGGKHRLPITKLLIRNSMVAGDLAKAIGIGDTHMSKELRLLMTVNVIKMTKHQNFRRYSIVEDNLEEIKETIKHCEGIR